MSMDDGRKPPSSEWRAALTQAEYILHVVQAGFFVSQEARGAQAAVRVRDPARRFVADFDAFAGAGEQHRMIADDIAAADGRKSDRRRIAFPGHAFAREDAYFFQVAAERAGDPIAHLQRGAG